MRRSGPDQELSGSVGLEQQPDEVGQSLPVRQVRAAFDEDTITVYQAYPPAIADPALAEGTFVPPFNRNRMTWIKPSFLWMMHRSAWATSPGQERVLRIAITRDGFEWALRHSCLSHCDPAVYPSPEQWAQRKRVSPVRVQWDPERSLRLEPLGPRTIQVGLGGEAVDRYVDDWIVGLTDVTELAHEVHRLVTTGDLRGARRKLPVERPYPLTAEVGRAVGITG